ncbi:MAG: hypothetical protein SO297_14945 [Clostridium paraputrificum]|nr:hypothetical protein [Clostridium paraputrificum]
MSSRTQRKDVKEMNSKKILELIPKLEQIKDPNDLEVVNKAIDSCLTVQLLKESFPKKVG